jgi:hypothetical protein
MFQLCDSLYMYQSALTSQNQSHLLSSHYRLMILPSQVVSSLQTIQKGSIVLQRSQVVGLPSLGS